MRWLVILALLWPLSATAGSGVHTPAVAGSDVVTAQPAALPDAMDCLPTAGPTHLHCHHATHGDLAVNTTSPEDQDGAAHVAHSANSPHLVAAALSTVLRGYPRPGDQPSFILFGNFRS